MSMRMWACSFVLSVSLTAGCSDSNSGDMGTSNSDLAVNLGDMASKGSTPGDMATSGSDGGGMAKMFQVTLTPGVEVPVCAKAGAAATGSAAITIDATQQMIVVSNLTYSGLSGAPTGAHIHSGAAATSGPVIFDFGTTLTKPINKTFTAADYPATPPSGAPATFAAFVAAMKAGQSYINIHTTLCGGGEIRAQIQ